MLDDDIEFFHVKQKRSDGSETADGKMRQTEAHTPARINLVMEIGRREAVDASLIIQLNAVLIFSGDVK